VSAVEPSLSERASRRLRAAAGRGLLLREITDEWPVSANLRAAWLSALAALTSRGDARFVPGTERWHWVGETDDARAVTLRVRGARIDAEIDDVLEVIHQDQATRIPLSRILNGGRHAASAGVDTQASNAATAPDSNDDGREDREVDEPRELPVQRQSSPRAAWREFNGASRVRALARANLRTLMETRLSSGRAVAEARIEDLVAEAVLYEDVATRSRAVARFYRLIVADLRSRGNEEATVGAALDEAELARLRDEALSWYQGEAAMTSASPSREMPPSPGARTAAPVSHDHPESGVQRLSADVCTRRVAR